MVSDLQLRSDVIEPVVSGVGSLRKDFLLYTWCLAVLISRVDRSAFSLLNRDRDPQKARDAIAQEAM